MNRRLPRFVVLGSYGRAWHYTCHGSLRGQRLILKDLIMTRTLLLSTLLATTLALGVTACKDKDAASVEDRTASEAPVSSSRDRIRIVGSSTVYPFSTTVAEYYGRTPGAKTPIVESTGTGGGLKLFCAGIGAEHPDMTNASRGIKKSEIDNCVANGIDDIIEVKLGYDGIVLANASGNPVTEISLMQLFLALAKDVPDGNGGFIPNPYTTWSDVDPSLSSKRIEVLGPPPTSGTRDAFVELAMEGGCKKFPAIAALKDADGDAYKARCHAIREDGAFVEAGENDNLIVQKLKANPDAYGIFGYGFLDQNSGAVQGAKVDGVMPTFEDISSGAYPVSRSMYFYVKKDHIGVIPGIEEFLAEFMSERAISDTGYLADKGLIPMREEERKARVASVLALETIAH